MSATRSATRTFVPPDGLRLVFLALLGVWLVFPFVVRGNLAQDAVPYVVAGDLARDHPEAIYPSRSGDLYDLDPRFATRACEVAPPGADCGLNVAFVSTPLALPFTFVVAALGGDLGVLGMRLVGAAALSATMWLLWQRLAHRTARAPQLLVVTALLLTPFVMAPVALGQTSELLALSACLGVTSTRRSRELLASAVWVATFALKAFPLALAVVLVWQRRWRLLAWSAAWTALLAVLALVAAPASLWSGFVSGSGRLAGQSNWNAYNGSVDAVVHRVAPAVTDAGAGSLVLLGVRAGLAAGLFWWGARRADDDTQWAVASLLLLLVVPFVWWHYLWVAVAAIGVALAGRSRLDDRVLGLLPLVALLTVPFSILNAQGGPSPVAQGLFLLAVAVLAAALARGEQADLMDRQAFLAD